MSTDPPIVLDADFLSSFTWVNRLDILEGLYSKRMIVLEEVLVELRRVPHLGMKVQQSIRNGHIRSETMFADSPEALQLAKFIDEGRYGMGEASCMAYLTYHEGILGSNNLADVSHFCTKNKQPLLTTAKVLYEAYNIGYISLSEADEIWERMLSKKQKLPTSSFSAYIIAVQKS